jgi:5-formyltetrahydrofolate cyclo-ligase
VSAAPGKAHLRRRYRQLRQEALPACADALSAAAQRLLPALVPAGKRLGLYWPTGHEPDLRPTAALLHGSGRGLALPRVRDGRLLYLRWRPGDALTPDECRIPAPVDGDALAAAELALLLVPALALDRRGIRLGSGGGWYDRLRADPVWRAIPALVVLPAACLAPALPRDPWDVPFDGWLDEQGLHRR